jgi:hypothetical protein
VYALLVLAALFSLVVNGLASVVEAFALRHWPAS